MTRTTFVAALLAASLIASGRAPVRPLLTHTFPLDEYRRALDVARDKGGEASVKVAFSFAAT